jgi:hypothetical protein
MIRRLAGGRVFTDYHDEAWHVSLYRIALIAIMAGSLAAGPLVLRYGLGSSWMGYLLPVAVVAGAAGALTTGLLGKPSWRDRRGAIFRLGEVLLLILLARAVVWAFSEGFPQLTDVPKWLLAPGDFFTGEFAFAAVTLILSWGVAVLAAADFRELAIQPDEVAARESREWGDSRSQWRAGNPRARTDILQGFAVRWIGLGIVLIVCAGLTRVSVELTQSGVVRAGLRGTGLQGAVVVALVAYFLSGLLLMSHGRLAVLRGRWYNQEVEIAPSLIRRWHTSSALFVALIALAALLLPLGATGWLARALEWLIAMIARIVMAVVFLFSLLIALIAQLFQRLFGAPAETPYEIPPMPSPSPRLPTQAELTSQLPPWLGGALLWLVVGAITVFLLVNFARTSGLLEGRLGALLLRWRLWWRARQARIEESLAGGMKRLRAPFARRQRAAARPPVPGRAGGDPRLPREQVRRYYLAAVKEAAEEGAPRQAHQTPSEFAADLASNWPESDPEIESLTEAFLDARYSPREIVEVEASRARSAWQRLAQALRRPKRDSDAPR